ncbi:MAG: hypothetical protein CM15mP10_0540 [Actinomycetota bacterium]|nr:MAG: hypothetical protein CM15mP10_0540 [Actinomycetota bacterium]
MITKLLRSHSLNSEITINNFITEFNFIEQRNRTWLKSCTYKYNIL